MRLNAGMADRGTSTCASRMSPPPPPVRTLVWLGIDSFGGFDSLLSDESGQQLSEVQWPERKQVIDWFN
jgi:hypothetical protein